MPFALFAGTFNSGMRTNAAAAAFLASVPLSAMGTYTAAIAILAMTLLLEVLADAAPLAVFTPCLPNAVRACLRLLRHIVKFGRLS